MCLCGPCFSLSAKHTQAVQFIVYLAWNMYGVATQFTCRMDTYVTAIKIPLFYVCSIVHPIAITTKC